MNYKYTKAVKLFQTKALKTSLEISRKALENLKGRERVKFLNLIGIIYHELGLFNQAVKAFRESLAIDDQSFQTWENLGIIYRRLNSFQEAETCFLKSLELNPVSDEVLTSLGMVYMFLDEIEKAIDCFEKSIKINATWGMTYGNLALAYALDNHFREAERCLQKAVKLGFPNHKEVSQRISNLKSFAQSKEKKSVVEFHEGDAVLN